MTAAARLASAPRRVLVYDASPGLGGAMTSLAALLPVLERAGWEASVAAIQPGGWAAAGLPSQVRVLPARGHDRLHGLAYYQREAERALALAALLRRERPDLLLANNGPTNNLAAYLAAGPLRIPVVQYLRGPFPATRLAGALLRRAAAVLAVGDDALAAARSTASVEAIPVGEGLDPARWPPPRQPEAHGIFWSSALLQWKGLPVLLEAHRLLGPAAPRVTACLAPIGPGTDDGAPRPETAPGVSFLEAPPDLDELRARHAIYVHTALKPEPFGRAVLEAMAAGLCPVVGDAGTPARLVRHGETGLHYQAGSAASLASTLRRLVEEPALAARLGAAAAEAARAYDAPRMFAPVEQSLDAVLRSTPGRSSCSGTEQPAGAAGSTPVITGS